MTALLLIPNIGAAQDWILRARVIDIDPDVTSQEIGDTGSAVAVDSAYTLELDVTYMFNKSVGLEVIAATAEHDLAASGGALNGADLGSVWVLPPTATLQWYIIPEGMLNLYAGVGINYTVFYSYDLSADLAGLGVTDIDFDNSFGIAGDLGVNLNFSDNWMINGDIKYIQIGTTADIMTADGVLDSVDVDVDPWVFGIGVGYRF